HVLAVAQAVGEAARRAEAGRRHTDARPQRRRGHGNVFADDLLDALAVDQPGTALEAELEGLPVWRLDVDVVIGVVADGVARLGDAGQPGDVGLLEDAPDREAVRDAARLADAPAGLDRPAFGFVVEVAFLV